MSLLTKVDQFVPNDDIKEITPFNIEKYYTQESLQFSDNEDYTKELIELCKDKKVLVLHCGNNTEVENIRKLVVDTTVINITGDYNTFHMQLAELDCTKYQLIYAIINESVVTQLLIKTDIDIDMNNGNNGAQMIKGFVRQMKGNTDITYCGDSSWYIDINNRVYRGNFRIGLGIDKKVYPLDILMIAIAYLPIKDYMIRVGVREEHIVELIEDVCLYTLATQHG